MATRFLARSLLTTKHSLSAVLSRSYTSLSLSTPPSSLCPSSFLRFRPLVAFAGHFRRNSPAASTIRGYATRQTSSSLNDPNPNWSNRPPKETILLDGCDFEHWLVVVEPPDPEMTRDQIIDSYVKILATVVGSEEEARMKLYSVSTKHYFAFGALISEEDSYKLKELPKVRWVLPDSYLDVKNKDYGGEPVINGQAVPYDPKYHAEWVRNNARANERNRRNDRPRNYDRSRNFERRRENMQNRGFQNQDGQNPAPNMGPMSQQGPPPSNMGGPMTQQGPPPPNMGGPMPQQGPPPPNMGGPMPHQGPLPPNMGGPMPHQGPPPPNMGGQPNRGVFPPNNMESQTHMGGMPSNNMGRMSPNSMGGQPNMGPAQYNNAPPAMQQPNNMVQNNMGRMPPNNIGGGFGSNNRGVPGDAPNYQYSNGPGMGGPQFQNREIHGPQQNREYQQNYASNPSGGNPYQSGNVTGRDMPQNPNYQ